MSYSCADFADDVENCCNDYNVPGVSADALDDCHPETIEGDALRLLAERTAKAFSDRLELLQALRGMIEFAEGCLEDATDARSEELLLLQVAREAIASATGGQL